MSNGIGPISTQNSSPLSSEPHRSVTDAHPEINRHNTSIDFIITPGGGWKMEKKCDERYIYGCENLILSILNSYFYTFTACIKRV
jgi:hypothetical protein